MRMYYFLGPYAVLEPDYDYYDIESWAFDIFVKRIDEDNPDSKEVAICVCKCQYSPGNKITMGDDLHIPITPEAIAEKIQDLKEYLERTAPKLMASKWFIRIEYGFLTLEE